MKIEFVGQSARDSDSTWSNSSRLLNFYREPVGDSKIILKSVLGTEAFATVTGATCRAAEAVAGNLYVAQGSRLWRVTPAGVVTDLGPIADGPTTISSNNGQVTVTAGGNYYLWDGSTLSEPTAGAFSEFGSVTFLGQLTVLTELNGRRVQWSDVADPDTLDGLNFATTETRDDNNLRALPIAGGIWFFKEQSIERWYQDGSDLAAVPGGTIDTGLAGVDLITSLPDGAFFVGRDGKVYLVRGGQMQPVSTVPVETSVAYEDPLRCFYYQDEGHEICVIQFADRPSWCFDISTREWHERTEGNNLDQWTAQTCVQFNGGFYAFAPQGIYRLTRNNVDATGPLIRRAVGRTFGGEGRFKINLLKFNATVGRSEVPVLMELRMSRDEGNTWGLPIIRDLGALGGYGREITYRQLGQYRQATAEVTISNAREVTLDSVAFVQ